nr:hypothetical protein [Flexivirga aerilata]
MKQRCGERIHIASAGGVRRFASDDSLRNLWRDRCGRASVGNSGAGWIDLSCHAEITDKAVASAVQKQIVRLNVVVQQATVVPSLDSLASLLDPSNRLGDIEPDAGDAPTDRPLRGDSCHKEWLAQMRVRIPDGEDVVIDEMAKDLRFAPDTERVVGRAQQLQCHDIPFVMVKDLQHVPLTATPEKATNLVSPIDQISDRKHLLNDTVLTMRAMGLAVEMKADQARLRAVIVNDSSGTAVLEQSFEMSGLGTDLATRLRDTAKAVGTKIKTLAPDTVVIRRADNSPAASRRESTKVRLLVEGAITAAASSECATTFVVTPTELASWTPLDKKALDAEGKALATGAGKTQAFTEATAAAIAALSSP